MLVRHVMIHTIELLKTIMNVYVMTDTEKLKVNQYVEFVLKPVMDVPLPNLLIIVKLVKKVLYSLKEVPPFVFLMNTLAIIHVQNVKEPNVNQNNAQNVLKDVNTTKIVRLQENVLLVIPLVILVKTITTQDLA